jgi:hypothetical protein
MKKCIADIKCTVRRRSILCVLFPFLVVASVVYHVCKSSVKMLKECLEVFVVAWKGR